MKQITNNFYSQKLAEGGAILAPMAGFTDAPFRKLCRDFGSAWAVTEMVSAKGMVLGDHKGLEIGEPYKNEPDLVIQIFGGEPELVAEGGRLLYERYQPKALDLNMGCPVKKITGKSCGSKLMLEPERAADIINALSTAVPIPVSAKMRLGYDQQNVIEVAQAVSEAGAALVAVHGRTAAQKYTGEANWEAIKDVADHVNVPIVGSGDVSTKEQFERYQSWGLGVMIARAATGQPWIFSSFRDDLELNQEEKILTAYKHVLLHLNWYGSNSTEREIHLLRKLRGQLFKYFEFAEGAREVLIRIETLSDLQTFILEWFALDVACIETNELKRYLDSKNKLRTLELDQSM